MLCERCRKIRATVHVTTCVAPLLGWRTQEPEQLNLCILCGKRYFASTSPDLLGPYEEILKRRARPRGTGGARSASA